MTLSKDYNNHIFVNTEVEQAYLVSNDIYVVQLNDKRKYVVSKWGFVGSTQSLTIYKGIYSNRCIDLTDDQYNKIQQIKNKYFTK